MEEWSDCSYYNENTGACDKHASHAQNTLCQNHYLVVAKRFKHEYREETEDVFMEYLNDVLDENQDLILSILKNRPSSKIKFSNKPPSVDRLPPSVGIKQVNPPSKPSIKPPIAKNKTIVPTLINNSSLQDLILIEKSDLDNLKNTDEIKKAFKEYTITVNNAMKLYQDIVTDAYDKFSKYLD